MEGCRIFQNTPPFYERKNCKDLDVDQDLTEYAKNCTYFSNFLYIKKEEVVF